MWASLFLWAALCHLIFLLVQLCPFRVCPSGRWPHTAQSGFPESQQQRTQKHSSWSGACAGNKWKCTIAVCRHKLVSQIFSKAAQGNCCCTGLSGFITKAGCSLFLYCLLKYKSQTINSENIVYSGSSLVSVSQDGNRVTRARCVTGNSRLTSCPPILSLLRSSADHGTSFPHQTRLQEAEVHLREAEGISKLCFFPLVLDSSETCRQNEKAHRLPSHVLGKKKKAFCHSYVLIERWQRI